jgi:hypothetical protein
MKTLGLASIIGCLDPRRNVKLETGYRKIGYKTSAAGERP